MAKHIEKIKPNAAWNFLFRV